MPLESDVAALVAASQALTNEVSNKVGAIDAAVAAKESEVDSFVENAISSYPCINLCEDSGMFDGIADNPNRQMVTLFAVPDYIVPYNSTTIASAGQFYQDNSTNGGGSGALTQTVIDLLAAQGRAGSRYGTEFFVMECTMGSGTLGLINGRYKALNRNINLTGPDDTFTIGYWVRAIDADIEIILENGYRNDTPVNSNQVITVADGWTYICMHYSRQTNWFTIMPEIYSNSGDRFQLALFTLCPGKVSLGMPSSHIPTINANFAL